MGKGKINNKQLDAIGGNFASVMLSIFNPFYKDAQHTSINCFVSGFDVKDGIASTTALVLNTDRMIVVGEGEINLKTEGLDMSLRPVSKKGSGSDVTERLTGSLGELARPFKLSGTLANPSRAIDPTQTAIVAGKLLGGTALFGPAGVAAALIGGDSESESSCVAAISAARKGVRTKKSFGADKVQGGAGQTFKDAGKELKRLFRR